MKWFENSFLPSFAKGKHYGSVATVGYKKANHYKNITENRLSEKQINIFMNYMECNRGFGGKEVYTYKNATLKIAENGFVTLVIV